MSETQNRLPLIGEKAPKFKAQTTYGEINFPDDFEGKWIVLFSHPADFTPVCTTEFYAFQKRKAEFDKLNVQLIGLSVDQVYSHIKWDEWIKNNLGVEIEFPIIADNTGKIASLFGMLHPETGGTQTVRAVFIIDPKGTIRTILYYPVELGRNIDEILRIVKALQVADKNNAAMPANWPNNELVKDHAIIPPANRKQIIEQVKQKYECYDWWFCHKKVEY